MAGIHASPENALRSGCDKAVSGIGGLRMTSNIFDIGLQELRRNWGWFLAIGIILDS